MTLKNFPLAWRWTDKKHALLPVDVLARIEPQTAPMAEALFRQTFAFNESDGLSERIFSIDQMDTSSAAASHVTHWLLSHHENRETCVYLSWARGLAVATTWGIFADDWSEFCYPGSDDLHVWSAEHDWVLFFHHEECLQFGKRLKG